MIIRTATLEDAKSICDIYNHYVENTVVSFETTPVSISEMQQRISNILKEGLPYYVCELEGKIVGYCYLHNWINRSAYSRTKEVTIYLDKDCSGKGIGTILYQRLFDEAKTMDIHSVIANICVPNEGSVRLHEKFGMKQVSFFSEAGWKFGKWHDIGHWQVIIT
ncbi:L-amino acid N-acyltransferase YncA [Dysgonomonadaceae bacterium PH5-43]|nr:L-amino acid N-acyltransferase YncA [Dysgonomonadaceae bacterium PH5-43]